MAGEVQQKYSRKENLNEKKKNSCTPSYPKKICMHLPEKTHLRETLTKKNAARNLPTHHITFLIVRPYVAWAGKTVRGECAEGLKEKVPSSIPSLFLVFFLLSYFIIWTPWTVQSIWCSNETQVRDISQNIFLKMRSDGCIREVRLLSRSLATV